MNTDVETLLDMARDPERTRAHEAYWQEIARNRAQAAEAAKVAA